MSAIAKTLQPLARTTSRTSSKCLRITPKSRQWWSTRLHALSNYGALSDWKIQSPLPLNYRAPSSRRHRRHLLGPTNTNNPPLGNRVLDG